MRYLVLKKENASPEVVVWSKSQYPIEVNLGITRECTHRDYIKKNNISPSDVSSLGMVYHDVRRGDTRISVLPWDTPAPKGDILRVRRAAFSFIKKNPDLLPDVQYEWNEYLWLKRQEGLRRHK